MKERPSDLDEISLRDALVTWGIGARTSTYAPVGFGDHHWTVEGTDRSEWFATVADLADKAHCGPDPDAAFDGLRRAMDAAAALAEDPPGGGLEFVVAPLRTREGRETVVRVGERYALSVFPHVAAESGDFGDELDAGQRGQVIDLLARLHRAEPPACVPVARPELPSCAALEVALAEAGGGGEAWGGGPYAEPARALLAEHAETLRRRLDELDAGVERLARVSGEPGHGPVVTHGEPHPGNLMRRGAGGPPRLVDWDTVGLAAPERDLWHVVRTRDDLDRYAAAAGREVDTAALAFFRLRWALSDVAEFVATFRSPHLRTPDTDDAWRYLGETLAVLGRAETS